MANWIIIYLVLINFFGIHLFREETVPSKKWFSFSSGIAITYFFMYLLPSYVLLDVRGDGRLGDVRCEKFLCDSARRPLFSARA
ncbi:hypothetical protein ACRPK6_01160 [Exiguobacterium sp. TRN 1102]|uniref:hypothetical protein n=1 Tax=Exiguobacterium sp. TRN 1102 TaxID=3420732 RepID=UPI003D76D1A5